MASLSFIVEIKVILGHLFFIYCYIYIVIIIVITFWDKAICIFKCMYLIICLHFIIYGNHNVVYFGATQCILGLKTSLGISLKSLSSKLLTFDFLFMR